MGKRLLIIERDHHGHRMTGVRVLLDALLALQRNSTCIDHIELASTEEGFASLEFKEQLADISHQFGRLSLPRQKLRPGPLSTALTKVQDWRRLVCSGNYDHVYIPYGDGLVQLLAILALLPWVTKKPRSTCVETILMRGSFAYPMSPKHTRTLAIFGLQHAPFDRIHLIDPLAYKYVCNARSNLQKRTRLLPDPITPTKPLDRGAAQQALDLPGGQQWIGCIGAIDERKGADLLFNAFARAVESGELAANCRLLLAGRHSEVVRKLTQSTNDKEITNRVVSIDRYLSEEELNYAVAALDVVATPYPGFVGSASIVLRAAAGQRYCLGANTGWMQEIVPQFELGETCDVNNIDSFAQAITAALVSAKTYQPAEKQAAFVQYGTIANVSAHWTDLLREKANINPDPHTQPYPGNLGQSDAVTANAPTH